VVTREAMAKDRMTIGILHPGEMGAAVGAAARLRGARVIWCSNGRSSATVRRAKARGLEDVNALDRLVNQSDVVISICPPHAAEDLARAIVALGYQGLFVDANAVSPQRARRIGETVNDAGATFVDGGIVGGPPQQAGTTRLYISGEAWETVADIFAGSPLEVIAMEGGPGAASALKMAYAAWSKGTTALLTAIHALAISEDVHEELLAEWRRSQPELLSRSGRGMSSAAAKAWRWIAEMEEIAATFAAAGLPDGFHLAAADVYRKLEQFKDDPNAPSGSELARYLLTDQ
jgi:3-hydroxyisobutyrate dehydrogenase-like beta-hydroxyacid dehydrogenase